jgi:ATP-binding cassette subfamily B protein
MRVPPRILAQRAKTVLGLAWAASPLVMLMLAALTVVSGVTPALGAWLNRELLNSLVPRAAGGAARHLPGGGGPGHHTSVQASHIDVGHVVVLAALLGAAGLVSAVVPHARQYGDGCLRRGFGLLIQDRLFAAITAFPGLARLESPSFTDRIELARQASQNAPTRLLSSGMSSAQSLITAAGFFGTLEAVSPVLAAIVMAAAVPAVGTQIALSRRRAELEWRASPTTRRQLFYARLLTDQRAAKEVRLFGLGDWLRGRMLTELRGIHDEEHRLDRRNVSTQALLGLLTAVISAGGLIWVVRAAATGRLSIGDVTMFAMAVVGVQGAISGMVTKLADAYESLLAFGHYVEVVSASPDLPLAPAPAGVPVLREGIDIRDVWFRYDDQHPWILRGVSLFIPAGTSAALIGLNGAGKSTLVKLICRFYDPGKGSIHWDGADIRNMDPGELRHRIGAVFQDYMAYDLTAAENIGIGDLAELDERDAIQGAARRADIHEKIAGLPHGYDTLLSRMFMSNSDRDDPQTGVMLSGGQWQRVALARGLLRSGRDLLILDEPSSGLDAEAEHAIHRRLLAMRGGSTSLLISHRLGSVRDADMIFVLSGGQVAEQGTHEQLMQAHGEYHRLFGLQARGYSDIDARSARRPAVLP